MQATAITLIQQQQGSDKVAHDLGPDSARSIHVTYKDHQQLDYHVGVMISNITMYIQQQQEQQTAKSRLVTGL